MSKGELNECQLVFLRDWLKLLHIFSVILEPTHLRENNYTSIIFGTLFKETFKITIHQNSFLNDSGFCIFTLCLNKWLRK